MDICVPAAFYEGIRQETKGDMKAHMYWKKGISCVFMFAMYRETKTNLISTNSGIKCIFFRHTVADNGLTIANKGSVLQCSAVFYYQVFYIVVQCTAEFCRVTIS